MKKITVLRIVVIPLMLFAYPFFALSQDKPSNFGIWKQDQNDLPAFELNFHKSKCPWYPFHHTMSTGTNMVVTNQWGDVHLLTTESGQKNLTPALWDSRGGFYPTISINNQLTSLLYTELDSLKVIDYGIGYTQFSGISTKSGYKLKVEYTIITPFNFCKGFYAHINIKNLSNKAINATLYVNSDIWIRPGSPGVKAFAAELNKKEKLHNKGIAGFINPSTGFDMIALIGSKSYEGLNTNHTIKLQKAIRLEPDKVVEDLFQFTYNTDHKLYMQKLSTLTAQDLKKTWVNEVKKADFKLDKAWINRESIWNYSQLLSFCFYDKSLNENFINLGGYGIGDVNTPTAGFSMREIAETAMILANFNPELSKSSLRWMAKTQTKGGDLKRNHNYKELKKLPENQMYQDDFPNESDTEIWFLMAIGEYVATTGDLTFLKEKVEYINEQVTGDMWNHAKATFQFIKNKIGTGEQGEIRMLKGDWNDYLSKIGQLGNGQSVMNSGMMCKALIGLIEVANKLGDPVAAEMKDYLEKLQQAVGKTFDKGWFIRAYDDHNLPVGGYDDRLFLNAQSWAVLGKCGTPAQRKLALENTIKYNSTPIGLTLMSKAYSSPTPENISWSPIPAGEGENAGIWPQTVAWFIWALADEGMTTLAMQEWKKSTLHQHTSLYPEIPFGIINGPDCYSSFHAKEREGWTQQAVFDRMNQLPMNPIIAWQPFGLIKIEKKK